jgi:NADH:ubiquinone oxidoreductase subunit F (NADH-binding)
MKVLEWARRKSGVIEPGADARRVRLPVAFREGVDTFYDYSSADEREHTCTGTACHFARQSAVLGPEVHCLGRCYEAPATSAAKAGEIPRASLVPSPVVLRHLLKGKAPDPASEYLQLPSGAQILEAVSLAGLRGRGGAAFPTGIKWKLARDTPARDRYVVANGDEGDPGAFVDRLLLEEDPHAVLAGMLACARAIGARRGIVFIRREYPAAQAAVRNAIVEAKRAGWLAELDVSVVSGMGSYVAGEETALLRSIEGLRAEPSPKPPYPAERGLEGLPTVIQNVETLAVVPWVVKEARRANTKVICLSGAVARPGAVEIELGTPLKEVLEMGGGGPASGRRFKMALIGGPMGRVLPASLFGTPLSFEALPGLGHGGIVAFDEGVSAAALARHLYAFAASESCGNCAPCRIGCAQLASRCDAESLTRLLDTLELGSLCGFGQGVPRPIRDLLQHFAGELF